jgi:hypothetical protein
MEAKPRPGFVNVLATIAVVFVVALPALAYQHPLSSTDIRNAYLLGARKDSLTAQFFAPYEHVLPMPPSGPFVSGIGVETPYRQIVELGQSALNSDVQDAEQRFANASMPFLVRVTVNCTATYPDPHPSALPAFAVPLPNFQKDFRIKFLQKNVEVEPEDSRVYLLYADALGDIGQISGAIIEVQYNNDRIDPYEDLTISVETPDQQHIETGFHLSRLK